MEDMEEEIIADEILIALVKANPVLYDKSHRDYKNQEVKKDAWNMLQKAYGTLLSAEELESRWNQLRNQFGKKLRERKTKPASGSSGGSAAKKVEWHLMGPMSFLIPYIAHRKGRSSTGNLHSATLPMSPRASSPISLLSPVSSPTIEQSIDFVVNIETDNSHTTIDDSNTSICDSATCGDNMNHMIKSKNLSVVKRKKVIPDLDSFAKKKQKNDDAVSGLLKQSTSVLSNLAAVEKSISECTTLKIDEQKHKNPFAETIFVAFDQVPVGQQMDCLIAILNMIKTYQNAC